MPINIDNTVYSDTEAISLIKKLRKENDELRNNKKEIDEQYKPRLSIFKKALFNDYRICII